MTMHRLHGLADSLCAYIGVRLMPAADKPSVHAQLETQDCLLEPFIRASPRCTCLRTRQPVLDRRRVLHYNTLPCTTGFSWLYTTNTQTRCFCHTNEHNITLRKATHNADAWQFTSQNLLPHVAAISGTLKR